MSLSRTQVIFAAYFMYLLQTYSEKVFEHCGLNEQMNKVLPGAVLTQIEDLSLSSCIKECQARTACVSINFNLKSMYCELNAETRCAALNLIEYKEGWTYMKKSDWTKSIDFACKEGICPDGYKCFELKSTKTTCLRSECAEPPKVRHAVFGTTDHGFNTTGSYECLADYKMYGNLTLTCQSDGTWTKLKANNTGCGIPSTEPCTTDTDCQRTVNNSECVRGLCVCANFTTYSTSNDACYTDCKSLYEQSSRTLPSGVYQVHLYGAKKTSVYCDMDKGGWTAIQRNAYDKSEIFTRGFDDYVEGFGSPNGSHWLGLNNIHFLTSSASRLLFEIRRGSHSGEYIFLLFDHFEVGKPDTYILNIGDVCNTTTGYESVAKRLYHHNRREFSTYDSDKTPRNCSHWTGAFWLGSCCTICGVNRDHRGYYSGDENYEYYNSIEMKVIRIY